MADRLLVGTRKGLFEIARRGGAWDVAAAHFVGDPVSAVLATKDHLFAALDLGHFGAKLWRRDRAAKDSAWTEMSAPAFPPKPEDAKDDPHPWTLGKIWSLEPGGVANRIWAGSMPGGLFRSDDGGTTWSLVDEFWRMPERKKWNGVAGGEQPGLSSVLVSSKDPQDIRVGVSTGGVWASGDEGKSWRILGKGLYAEYMPPELREDLISQDVHQLARCAAKPEVMWCQHHNGAFRSEDAGATWRELVAIRPSKFGFAVAAHPKDPNTAWFVPAVKDEKRIPADAKLVVARTRDGGNSFDVLRSGLPQQHAYDLVYRHALAVDESGERLAFGSTSGGLWISEDGGDTWSAPEARLPPIAAVRFAAG